ncbi:transmembrane channel-like protein 5 isoform X2 [Lepus europaeus]|uniref:transmembrane channel-like protein 5 isoform X2 n=1 Tax=Lepus europaeus TaxID=9983 RepID=UPI002B467264|nr:transmembrane channel-like protein 5 isoform X2 [Lepus europaeus]
MSAFYRNKGYEETPVYSGHSGSQNYTRGYSSTRDYPDFPDPLNKPDYPSASSSPSSAGSRKSPDYLLSLPEPDYSDSQSSPYHRDSSKDLDYRGSQRNPEFAGSRSNRNYEGSRTSPDYLVSLGEPDYPGAQGTFDSPIPRANSNLLGSRRNLQYAGSGVNRSTRSLGQPDYPGAENQPSSSHFLGKPGYLVAENFQNSPDFWGNPDYPGAEDGRDYGSSDTLEVTRRVLTRTSSNQPSFHCRSSGPLGVLGGDHEDYPENIEMTSMRMANPYDPSLPGAPGNGYVNPAFGGEGSPIPAYGNPPLTESHWYKSPQGQKLIASLIPMTSRDRIKTIRNQPRTMEEKRNLRKIVDKEKSKQSHRVLEFNCCAQCLSSISLGYRRAKSNLSELLNSVSLWQKTLKVIGGKFGTSVLSYFNFLRWLLKFNIFSFILNFSFITIPQFTVAEKNSLQFTGLELLTGAGYFRDTVLYYGYYTNSTIQHEHSGVAYNMQLAYIFTIGACLITCFFSLLFSMAKYFRNNFINPHIYSRGIAKLIFCWDFTVTHEKAVKLKQKNLSTEIRENLSEIRQENARLTFHQQLTRFSAHIVAWVVSTGVAVACCVAVYYLAEYNSEFLKKHRDPWAVLLLPFVVSCINLVVPRFYSMFRLVERYEMPRHEVYTLLIRNIFLKMSIIGILCYYWLNIVALSGEECWETLIGQEIYRLLLMDFLFSLADSFLGEFLRRIIGMRFITSLGLQEFDIARNVLELIYAQTLVWIGIFFCPLLPFIQMITLFIMFYVKNISLMMNFQPPSKAWRASQMMTFFIFLLFFPSFTGVLCTLAITIWRIITYLYWQITEGRKIMIRLLHEQIINEGKDKMFLIDKLIKLQDAEKRANPSSLVLERREVEQQGPLHFGEHEATPDLRYRRSVQEDSTKA